MTDTSPLNYLVLIDLQRILPALFDRVMIPDAVWRELGSPAAPEPLKEWLGTSPSWLDRRFVSQIPPHLQHLGSGEREAIALAQSVDQTSFYLMRRGGRKAARNLGLSVSGTLGILDLAARRGLVDLADALERLERTTFRATPRLLRRIQEMPEED